MIGDDKLIIIVVKRARKISQYITIIGIKVWFFFSLIIITRRMNKIINLKTHI